MIRAAFFDIDGTLVSMDTHRMREDTKEALFALKKKGIRIFISTGRHMQDIRTAKGDLLEGVPFDGYVLINGQYCILIYMQLQMGKLVILIQVRKKGL